MGYTNRIRWEELRSIDSATFDGTYKQIGTPLVHPSVILKMVNNSNVLVTISLDGVTDVDVAPANSFWLYDEDAAGAPAPEAVSADTQVWVKGSAGVGSVYLVSQYNVRTP
jgi:hypothetical protein